MPEPLSSLMGFLAEAFRKQEPIPHSPPLAEACAERVSGNSRLTPAEQVDIYRRQYWLRHIDSLNEDYPGLIYVLGEDGFDRFCRAYLEAHPPRKPSLRDLGVDIVAFAERWDGFPEAKRAIALEMVRYENAFIDLFDGADPPALDADKIRSLPPEAWETATIVLHPLLVLTKLSFPVHRIRLAARAGTEAALERAPEPLCLAVYRKDFRVHFEELTPPAYELLLALGRGEALIPACDRIAAGVTAEEAKAIEANVGAWFQQWSAWGFIVDVIAPKGDDG